MIRKAAVILASLICTVLSTRAQESFTINDYDLIGVNYGVSFSEMNFANEVKKQERLFNPTYVSLTYTHYLKLFDFLPYFGYQMGLAYGHEGYRFKVDKEMIAQFKELETAPKGNKADGAPHVLYGITPEEKKLVWGLFGDKDRLVNFQKEFQKCYGKEHFKVVDAEHRLNSIVLKKEIIPLIHQILGV